MSDHRRAYEDLVVGEEYVTPGRTVTETDVMNFAGVSGDFNVLHTDEEYMKNTRFGRRIAHGLLILAMQSGLGTRSAAGPTRTLAFLGLKEWNFKGPVYIGDTITLRFKLLSKREVSKGNAGIVEWGRTIVNQHGEVVQEGIAVSMVAKRSA